MPKLIRLMTFLTALLILAGCVGADRRRQNYLDDHPDLSPTIADAIAEGRIMEGMSSTEVLAAWGDPVRTSISVTEFGDQESWTYTTPIGQFKQGTVILLFYKHKLSKLIN